MTTEEKQEIRNIIKEEMMPVNDVLNRYKSLIENDDTIGHVGLASRFSYLESKVQKIDNIKNAAIWIVGGITTGLTMLFNLLSSWFRDSFIN